MTKPRNSDYLSASFSVWRSDGGTDYPHVRKLPELFRGSKALRRGSSSPEATLSSPIFWIYR
ncbi:hypothetical protein DYH09_09110 [bacterium CPR1]|nr:hypothetical protein [bacterium CPR1]